MAKKKKQSDEEVTKPGQLPPTFTDMLALLLTFFVFLMTMAQFDEASIKDVFSGMARAFGRAGEAATGTLEDGSSMGESKNKQGGGSKAREAAADPKATLRAGSHKPGEGAEEISATLASEPMDQDSKGPTDLPEPSPGDPEQKVGEESQVVVAEVEQQQFEQGVMDLGELPGVDATMTSQGLKIELQEGFARFGSGSANLPADAVPKFEALIKDKLQGFIDDKFEISVVGHTDDVPLGARTAARYGDNRGLSTERANTVLRMFERMGVNPRQISAQGYGPHRPKTENETADGRGLNRRIEILVKYKVFSVTDWGEDVPGP